MKINAEAIVHNRLIILANFKTVCKARVVTLFLAVSNRNYS
jgi:hypothetical protein